MIPATLLLLAASACAQPAPQSAPDPDWRSAESPILTGHIQLTFPDRFTRAGEAYFSPDEKWIIFQAIEAPKEGAEASPVYAMYVARLKRDEQVDAIVGIEDPILLSAPGSANTCGFFHPKEKGRVIFGSTLVPPSEKAPAGYQRGTSSYAWQFPTEMEVVTMIVPPIVYDGKPKLTEDVDWSEDALTPTPIWTREGYDAECAYSPSGRYIVHAEVNAETKDSDLFAFDTQTQKNIPLVVAKGYDGGPFFSPDGSMIGYRSDRRGNDLLQIFIAELAIAEDGSITGVKKEKAVTDNEHVNWAPFWHPSGEFLIYATSEQGHQNYEVYAVQPPIGLSSDVLPAGLKKKRITHAAGFDGLPVFSPSGRYMMWTSQRGAKLEHEQRPSSQLWVAKVGDPAP